MPKKALLIGVSQYEAGLPPLAAAPKDVAAMQRVLQSSELGAFDEVKTLIDPDLEAMQTAIDLLFQSCQKGDLGLLYFSGHGITDDSDRLYLATRRTSKDTFRSTAVSASFIQGIMRDHHYQRQHVLILDCCYSGAFAEGWLAKSVDINLKLKHQLVVEGSVVLTSSTSTQKSYEDKEGDLSLYTKYIVQGIELGEAEWDNDGFISARELHEYAKQKVQVVKPTVKPAIFSQKEGFNIILAKSKVATKLKYPHLMESVENGKVRSANSWISKLFRFKSKDASGYFISGKERYDSGDKQRALSDYNEAIRLDPNFIDAYNSRGNIKRDLGDFQGAIADYTEAIRINSHYVDAYNNRGQAKKSLGDLQGAIADYTEAISLDIEFVYAYLNRGLCYRKLGNSTNAAMDFQKAVQLYREKGDLKGLREASWLYHREMENRLFSIFYYLLKYVFNCYFFIGRNIGQIAFMTFLIIMWWSQFQQDRVNRSKSLLESGLDKYEQKDIKGIVAVRDAITDYNEAIILKPDFAEIYNNRGIAKRSLGNIQEAIIDYDEAIRLKPDYAGAYNNRGLAKSDLENLQEAIADYNTAIRLKPDLARAFLNLGNAHRKLGDNQKALVEIRKAAKFFELQGEKEEYQKAQNLIKELGG